MTQHVVGLVCALDVEARHLSSASTRKRASAAPASLADGTLLAISGVGLVAAARAAATLVAAGASALVSWGLAGGLDPTLDAGTILLPDEIVSMRGKSVPTTPQWVRGVAQALQPIAPTRGGRLISTVHPVGSTQEKAAMFAATGAAAVDMESLAVAELAAARHLPFLAVRVIVDGARDELPSLINAAADASGRLRLWPLTRALARTPGEVLSLIRLAGRYRAASRSLARVARCGLPPPPAWGAASIGDRA